MLSTSFKTSWMVVLTHCRIFILAQFIGWSFVQACSGGRSVQACSAMAALSVRHFVYASLCSFNRVPSLCLVSPIPCCRCMVPSKQRSMLLSEEGVLYLGEKTVEDRTGPKHHSDATVPTHLPDPLLTPATYGRKAKGGFLVSLSSSLLGSLGVCCTVADCMKARG